MKKEFRIVALHALPAEGILLTLIPVFSVRIDQPGDPRPERVIIGPSIQSEDAKAMQEVMKGVLDELERRYGPMQQMHPQCMQPMLTLALTKEDYDGLGKPLVNQTVTLSVEKAEEEKGEFQIPSPQ